MVQKIVDLHPNCGLFCSDSDSCPSRSVPDNPRFNSGRSGYSRNGVCSRMSRTLWKISSRSSSSFFKRITKSEWGPKWTRPWTVTKVNDGATVWTKAYRDVRSRTPRNLPRVIWFLKIHGNAENGRKPWFSKTISFPNIINLPSPSPSRVCFEREKREKVAAGGRWGQIDFLGNAYFI